jgi:hypothetical protein
MPMSRIGSRTEILTPIPAGKSDTCITPERHHGRDLAPYADSPSHMSVSRFVLNILGSVASPATGNNFPRYVKPEIMSPALTPPDL